MFTNSPPYLSPSLVYQTTPTSPALDVLHHQCIQSWGGGSGLVHETNLSPPSHYLIFLSPLVRKCKIITASLKILIMLNNGRVTFHAFEPNSGNIAADTEMNRIGEIVGNEMASFDVILLELSSSAAAAVGYLVDMLASSPRLLLPLGPLLQIRRPGWGG